MEREVEGDGEVRKGRWREVERWRGGGEEKVERGGGGCRKRWEEWKGVEREVARCRGKWRDVERWKDGERGKEVEREVKRWRESQKGRWRDVEISG